GCMMNGKIYPFGPIERTEKCENCYCNKYAIQCCSFMTNPPHYDKEKCKVIFNRKRCDYDVVQKDNPSKVCSTFRRV
ncbi:MSMB protein, partial [Cercotrichas coryphoeus]|nr:MSMB protein [Cercotrichas coryphoeus]